MPRPNWFFAFPIDGVFLLDVPAPPPGLRRFHPEDVHMTLSFLGACGEAAAEAALTALDERLARRPQAPLAVSLAEVVPMGSRRAYSALSALLDAGRAEAEACIGALRDTLSDAAHARREERPPKAHITLARPQRSATNAQRNAGLAWAASLDLRHVRQTVDRVALYTWHEDRGERLFHVVAERRLR